MEGFRFFRFQINVICIFMFLMYTQFVITDVFTCIVNILKKNIPEVEVWGISSRKQNNIFTWRESKETATAFIRIKGRHSSCECFIVTHNVKDTWFGCYILSPVYKAMFLINITYSTIDYNLLDILSLFLLFLLLNL